MSKLFLDLSKMTAAGKKGEHAIFEHKDGHQIYVKSSALTPNMRKQLEDLVKTKMAKGGKVEAPLPMAEGGEPVASTVQDTPEQIAAEAQGLPPTEQLPPTPSLTPEQIAYNQEIGSNPRAKTGDEPQATPVIPGQPVPPMAPQSEPPPASPQAETLGAGPAQMPESKAPEQSPISGGLTKGIQEQRQGIEQEALAKAQQSKDAAHAIEANQINRQMADQHYQEQLTGLNNERQALQEDIKNGHIDPQKYISDMSVPQKLATGIGLLLGGIGGGLTHQENPALKFLNSQIDRNIDAQVKELGKKENLLSANFRQFGNIQSARDFTRINMNDQLKNQIDLATAKAGTPMAQAEALKAKGTLDQQSGMLMAKIGAIQTINSPHAQSGDINSALQTLRFTDPEQAKEIEGRLVPGVGIGSVPVPAEARNKILAHQQLDDRAKDLLAFTQKHTGALDPRTKAEGEQKVLALQSLYREGVLGTVYREGEQPLLDKIVKDPTSFFNKYGNIPKLQELIKSNDARYSVLKKDYGIRPLGGQQQSAAPQIKTFQKAK